MTIRFATIGLMHNHMYSLTNQLIEAGAELLAVYEPDPALREPYTAQYPQARVVDDEAAILQDDRVQLVISAPLGDQRADLGVRVMQAGKDYLTDKPGFTTLAQLEEARRVQAVTGRIFYVYYSERFANPASVKAGELVQAGAIGDVIQVVGFGPHKMNPTQRPAWFFRRVHVGGILNDLACHQADQFLFYTGSTEAAVVSAQVGNFHHPQYPELEDYGDMLLRSDRATGFFRVDWLTPAGLETWGDVRLLLLGTEGTIEVRKNIDLAGRPGANHLFLIDQQGTHYFDFQDVPMPFGEQVVQDVLNRTETAMSQAHCFLASELALKAQAMAHRLR